MIDSIFKFNDIQYNKKRNKNDKVLVVSGTKLALETVDERKSSETKSLKKQILFYKNEVNFFNEKLNNKDFINKAPLKIINKHKLKLKEAKKNLKLLTEE